MLADLQTQHRGHGRRRRPWSRVPCRSAPGTVVERSHLRGPLVIGANARISDAYVGPFSAIADGVTLRECEIEHSIVLDRSEIPTIAGPHRVEPDRPRRGGDLERRAPERAPADAGRFEPGGAGVKVMVTGAAGMLGARAGAARCARAGHEVLRARPAPRPTSPTPTRVRRARARVRAPTGWRTWRRSPTWTCCESEPERAFLVNGRARATPRAPRRRRARRCWRCRPTTCSTARRRDAAPRGRRGRARCSVYGRSKLAGERGGARGQPAAPHRAHGVALRRGRPQLRRHDPREGARRATRCAWSTTSAARRR